MVDHSQKSIIAIDNLRKIRQELPSIGSEIMNMGDKTLCPMDFVVIGIVKRSLSITAGLESLVFDWNMTGARALLRMQLDTVLRFSAFWLSADMQKMAHDVMSGKKINKIKDKDGQKMTDAYLVKKLSEYFTWVAGVYEYTSGYIHFSDRQLLDPVQDMIEEERTATFIISEKDTKFPESSWLEVVECAHNCLQIIKYFLCNYKDIKSTMV